jgi:hypothetical protein
VYKGVSIVFSFTCIHINLTNEDYHMQTYTLYSDVNKANLKVILDYNLHLNIHMTPTYWVADCYGDGDVVRITVEGQPKCKFGRIGTNGTTNKRTNGHTEYVIFTQAELNVFEDQIISIELV